MPHVLPTPQEQSRVLAGETIGKHR